MAYFLFIDESGHDQKHSPYEVLAGLAVEDRDVWNLITALNGLEERLFGLRYSRAKEEIKGKKFLKRKVFRQAGLRPQLDEKSTRDLARQCLLDGANATIDQLAALAHAKLAYVQEALELCVRFQCRAFASIIHPSAPRSEQYVGLRKDYAYHFERFFYFLEDRGGVAQGIMVFDELDKSQSKILLDQIETYFVNTSKGRVRSSLIIPEPFFVHSDLTSLIQMADLVAYIISWGFRLPTIMTQPARPELADFVSLTSHLRYKTYREVDGENLPVWSFTYIDDLRGIGEKGKGNVQ